MADYKLEMRNLRKEYPGTVALKDFSAKFDGGKVHAIIGKNGSGKSTLIKMLSGAIEPTQGAILVDGKETQLRSPQDAFAQGIATVYQELSLIPDLTVAENLLLGRLPKKPQLRQVMIDWPKAYQQAQAVLDAMQVDLPVRSKVSRLSVGKQQVVEIAKAMSFNPSVLMLDEPTSALARHETESLFALVRKLRGQGVAVLYISHRLQELYEIADTVTVLRDGAYIGTIGIKEATPQKIVDMMFGEVVQKNRPPELQATTQPVMEVRHLSRGAHFEDVNFTLYKGEVLGIAGMLGSGRSELLRAIFGADPYDSGEIRIHGQPVANPSPVTMKARGVAMTPENRKEAGLVLALSTRANICMASMEQIAFRGLITKQRELEYVTKQIKALQIKVPDIESPVSSLSGGNQQKVVIGNWLNISPQIMFFDEPSRGVDVQAKQQIFQIMWALSQEGISSVFVSTELEELLEVCHRILIMKQGKMIGEVLPEQIELNALYARCMED